MKRLIKYSSLMVLMVMMIVSCATFNMRITAKKALIMADDFYTRQYDDYLTFCELDAIGNWQIKSDVSDEMRVVLAKRKDMLARISELSDQLEIFIKIGELPPDQTLPALEAEIIDIIRRFE